MTVFGSLLDCNAMHSHMQIIDQEGVQHKHLQAVIVMLRGLQLPNAFSDTKVLNQHNQVEPSKHSVFTK